MNLVPSAKNYQGKQKMIKFETLQELIEAYAKKKHESNLSFGDAFTKDPDIAQKDGYEIRADDNQKGLFRISNLKTEIDRAKRQCVQTNFTVNKGQGYPTISPAFRIHTFGYALQ
jgi:hypothetical protein